MEQYKAKLKIQNLVMGICCLVLALFAILAIGSELGWFSVLKPMAGDDHWHSSWYGYCTSLFLVGYYNKKLKNMPCGISRRA